jgi:hypothetical protein
MQNFRKANTLQVSKFTEKSDSNFSKLLKRQSKHGALLPGRQGRLGLPFCCGAVRLPLHARQASFSSLQHLATREGAPATGGG